MPDSRSESASDELESNVLVLSDFILDDVCFLAHEEMIVTPFYSSLGLGSKSKQ